ncbi:MAG: DUF3592 domain-containing protein [Chloroherpetonaceae bacterium]|nr:DUF3592 domain-containing protein [Chloroherpetonaceae bacterium]MCS7211017.1 DUF3592 domain-containing protein [Chloroherpetonaceae bacterium]MDW8019432.1 DUF3592 domain-containing protein [Chloroherpetonaceae bacterium]MDW8466036.1 DUF3592 domain-containing protein [Chloroherpetonaceae bacterium]
MEVGPFFGAKLLLSLAALSASFGFGFAFLRRHISPVRPFPTLAWLVISTLGIIGIALTLLQTHALYRASAVRQWPTAEGIVLDAHIQGKRGFVPVVTYQYVVSGDTHTVTKELFSPQFGGKDTRKQSSEKILSQYTKGTTIAVHYNPDNPAESEIEFGITWATFIRLGVGLLLFAVCSGIVFYKLFQRWLCPQSISSSAAGLPEISPK